MKAASKFNRLSSRAAISTLASVGVLLAAAACGSSSEPEEQPAPGDPKLRTAILTQLGEEVILSELSNFDEAASALKKVVKAFESAPDDDSQSTARESFQSAMSIWQRIEVMQIGPLATGARGGDELRAHVYSWPATNTCRIDQILVDDDFSEEALADQAVNSRGLDALEYLLFNESTKNTCSSLVDINEDGTWDELSEDELSARRRSYALSAAALVSRRAGAIVKAYSGDDGFVSELVSAGKDSEIYTSSQDAFNDWATALFYLDTETKDMKLAQPASIMDCPGSECPVESIYSEDSLSHIEENLSSFDLQFFGGLRPDDGPGLDDLLADIGHAEVAEELANKIDKAYKALAKIEAPLKDAVNDEDQEEALENAFNAIKAVTDLYKTQIMSLLSLSLDSDMASDTD